MGAITKNSHAPRLGGGVTLARWPVRGLWTAVDRPTRHLQLQPRDYDVLARLWAAGILLTSHVHALYWRGTSEQAVRQRLDELYRAGLVQRHHGVLPKGFGRAQTVWALSKRGFQELRRATPPWFAARWPDARWRGQEMDRALGGDQVPHRLIVADVACWAAAAWGYEWVFESEPDSAVKAGMRDAPGGRMVDDHFQPDAVLRPADLHQPSWYLEVERASYGPGWKRKAAAWEKWVDLFQVTGRQPDAIIVVVGYLRDGPGRWERSVVPLLRPLVERAQAGHRETAALVAVMYLLDLAVWNPRSANPQIVPVTQVDLRAEKPAVSVAALDAGTAQWIVERYGSPVLAVVRRALADKPDIADPARYAKTVAFRYAEQHAGRASRQAGGGSR